MPVLEVKSVTKTFSKGGGLGQRTRIRAVDDVSFSVEEGECLGIVGESGCGKSTLARIIVRLLKPDAGEVRFSDRSVDSDDPGSTNGSKTRRGRARSGAVQMVFQNPYSSLNPRLTVDQSIRFNLEAANEDRVRHREIVTSLLASVGLPERVAAALPSELSGGERQRVSIARALATRPAVMLLDEPTSALDKSAQAQVLNLLSDLRQERALSYVFISHDLQVIGYLSDRIAVMYLGRIVEFGAADLVAEQPRHPYTQALFSAAPSVDPDVPFAPTELRDDPPDAANIPSGCAFHPRCAHAMPVCAAERPAVKDVGGGQLVACHLY